MKKTVIGVVIAAIIYLCLYLLSSSCGLIHPACYAYVGTVIPLLFAFVYLYVCTKIQTFGAAAFLNGFVLVLGLIAGEGNLPFIIGMVVLAALAEIIRKFVGYKNIKGVRFSFVPFAFSFYAYSSHWWTDTAGSLEAAVEEMPAGYADKMEPVIDNTPMLILMLILVIPVAFLGMLLAEKVMKKQVIKLEK